MSSKEPVVLSICCLVVSLRGTFGLKTYRSNNLNETSGRRRF